MTANDLINCDPEIMSGAPVFMGTRVPIKTLFDYLKDGYPLSEFLEDFDSVSREQAVALLELYKSVLIGEDGEDSVELPNRATCSTPAFSRPRHVNRILSTPCMLSFYSVSWP